MKLLKRANTVLAARAWRRSRARPPLRRSSWSRTARRGPLPRGGSRSRRRAPGAGRGVDHEIDIPGLDAVDDGRRALPSFIIRSTGTPIRRIACAVPPVARIRKPMSCSEAASWVADGLSLSVTLMNTAPSAGSAPAAAWRLAEGGRVVAGDAHHLAGRLHLRAEQRVGAREAHEGQHRLLDRDVRRNPGGPPARVEVAQALAEHQPAGHRRERHAHRLGHERNGARGARGLASITYSSSSPCTGELDVDEPYHAEAPARSGGRPLDLVEHLATERHRGDHARRVPEWTPASSTCCMSPPRRISWPSQRASTSVSMAFSRNRSR